MVAWSQTLTVRWRPTLRFVENKEHILRLLEDGGLLSGFNVGTNRISAKIGDDYHELSVDVRGLALTIGTPKVEPEFVDAAIQAVAQVVGSVELTRMSVTFQHVLEIADDYDTARRRAARRLVNDWMPGVRTLDWAVLLDIENDLSEGQLQFGIVDADELPERLSGEVSSFTEFQPDRQIARNLPELPAVALFVESRWTATAPSLASTLEEAQGYWANTVNQANEALDSLYLALLGPDE